MGDQYVMSIDGRYIFDETSDADVKIQIDGNWESDEQRIAYARAITDRLNGLVEC